MINECNSDLTHAELISYTAQHLRGYGWTVRTEFALKNRRIADVLAISQTGTIAIFECKTTLRGWEQQTALARYLNWCHQLVIVINAGSYRAPIRAGLDVALTAVSPNLGVSECDRVDLRAKVYPRIRPLDDERRNWIVNAVAQAPPGRHWLRGRLTAMQR